MDMNQLMQTFLAESRDLLEDMERHLLQAERGESSPDAVNAIFRAAHTIKGSGGLFDLPQLVGFTHVVESVLDLVREESVALQSELIALLLVCCDHIHALVETAADPSHADPAALAAEAEPCWRNCRLICKAASAAQLSATRSAARRKNKAVTGAST